MRCTTTFAMALIAVIFISAGAANRTLPVSPALACDVRSASLMGIESNRFTISGGVGGNFAIGQLWTLALTGAPANTSFSLCFSETGAPADCISDFGTTDVKGNWTLSGTFGSNAVGGWLEWIQLPTGALSNRVTIMIGEQSPVNLVIDGATGANFTVGQPWTLELTGGPANTPFSLCFSESGDPAECIPNFGATDVRGGWTLSGTFASAAEGNWTEWVQFPSGQMTNRIFLTIGINPLADFTINGATGASFTIGQPWTLVLAGAPANTTFSLCYSQNGKLADCMANFGTTDAKGGWTLSGTLGSTAVGSWTEWVQFPSGTMSNRTSLTVNFVSYQVYGIDFGPYEADQDPNSGMTIGEDQIRQRLSTIAAFTSWVRTYGSTHGLENTSKIAREFGLKTAIGAWLGTDNAANDQEIANLIAQCKKGYVDLAIVGSEVLLRGDLPRGKLLAYMAEVRKAAPGTMVTTADTYGMLLTYPDVVAACDVIYVNDYPFWNYYDPGEAVNAFNAMDSSLQSRYPQKDIIISETGWPSSYGADPAYSAKAAASYFLNLVSWARASNRKYFYFEAFDEAWKANYEGSQAASWGIWDQSGNMKPGMFDVFDGMTVPDDWTPPSKGPDAVPPSTPAGLLATAVSATQVNLAWGAATDDIGVAGYSVYRSGARVATTRAASLQDTGLEPSTSYLYTVAAFDAAGNTSGQSESGLVTTYAIRDLPDTTPPSAPANLSAAAISAGKIYLTWTASTDPVIPGSITSGTFGYDIYRNGTQIAATTSPSYLDIDLITVDHQYTYMVDAYDAQGNVSAMLAASSISTSCGQQPPGGPGTASIQLTFVPLIDTFSNLEGQVLHVAPTDYYLAVFIHAYYGWWTKPSWSTPRTQINCDGTWTCDITTGGVDETADQIAAYLFPKDYDAPLASGGSLPSELETHAVAKVTVSRK